MASNEQRISFVRADAMRMMVRLTEVSFKATGWGVRQCGRLFWDCFLRHRISQRELLGEAIAELLQSLGATFVKLGQILSSRPDLLPPEVVASRLRSRSTPAK